MLFDISKNKEMSYITWILKKIWPKLECTEELIAFIMAIYKTILNPNNEIIQINESIIIISENIINLILLKFLYIIKIFYVFSLIRKKF